MNEPVRPLLDFLIIAEFSQTILLIFILLVMEKNKKANIFFAAFLFILSSNFFSFYLFKSDLGVLSFIFALFSVPGISITGVLIYFYALSITGLLESFYKKQLFHFLIFPVSFIFFIVAVHTVNGVPHESDSFRKAIFIIISIGLLNSISYIAYTMVVLHRYYHKIENYYSDLDRMNLKWLSRLNPLTFITLAFWCVGFWTAHLGIVSKSPAGLTINISMLIIIIFITAYNLINQPEVFRQNIEMNHLIEDHIDSAESEKYARQSIDESMQDEYLAKLNMFMNQYKPYLNENITIKDLAEELQIPSHHLSIVINNRLNKNFYTFINEYRIKEAAAILENPDNSEASIIAIAFRSGFNSKSTFNSVFKKITGQTPSEYRSRNSFRSELAS